ncbi:hypothetical protein FQA47_013264 [Oryzias melastigma]|uniref:Uncharacterized protein n=1 Tax=Oryzias melastigma TaxID=30732 RepID=A0A834F1V2_ORYME|nr:hypothetical protein FQA47_013264 [Oryzias melastigma]
MQLKTRRRAGGSTKDVFSRDARNEPLLAPAAAAEAQLLEPHRCVRRTRIPAPPPHPGGRRSAKEEFYY